MIDDEELIQNACNCYTTMKECGFLNAGDVFIDLARRLNELRLENDRRNNSTNSRQIV